MTTPRKKAETLRLYCPVCGREKPTPRDPSDPPTAVEVAIFCDRCCGGVKDSAHFYDAAGDEVGL